MYVSNDKLRELIQQQRDTGQVPDELITLIGKIAAGIHQRYRLPLDVDDFRQDATMHILARLHLVQLDKNIFNYLSTLAMNLGRYFCRAAATAAQRQHLYFLEKKAAGDLDS